MYTVCHCAVRENSVGIITKPNITDFTVSINASRSDIIGWLELTSQLLLPTVGENFTPVATPYRIRAWIRA